MYMCAHANAQQPTLSVRLIGQPPKSPLFHCMQAPFTSKNPRTGRSPLHLHGMHA